MNYPRKHKLLEIKAAYPEYRQARDDMRELLTIQSNVDKIFDTGMRGPRKKKNKSGVDRFCSQASEGCAASSGMELFKGDWGLALNKQMGPVL
ncbi:hypothetical protein [Oscillibacter sp.]|uniref:hypothetical protein n=1 Tax=Oscillibacter sp. TaxID=1945593 RepID=UPI0028AF6929|nr:hypothetical protein [Oscillibacter sp.]